LLALAVARLTPRHVLAPAVARLTPRHSLTLAVADGERVSGSLKEKMRPPRASFLFEWRAAESSVSSGRWQTCPANGENESVYQR
jgi:hypothetical protein